MVIREPLVRAVATLSAVCFIVDAILHPLGLSKQHFLSIALAVSTAGGIAALLTCMYYKVDREDRIASLQGETIRGMTSPLWKVPQQRPPLPSLERHSDSWFSDVPEIVDATRRDGFSPVGFWNQWCELHGQASPHVRLAKRILLTLGAQPQFPAGFEPTHHGGRSLLSHCLLVAFYCHSERTQYQFGPSDMRGIASRDKTFNFDKHRESPLILIMGLAHDIGKLVTYKPIVGKPGYFDVIDDEHDRQGVVVLSRMSEWWELPTEDRDTIAAVVGHYHAERRMPIANDNRAIDDLRHALVYLLIKADTKAGAAEGSYLTLRNAQDALIGRTTDRRHTTSIRPIPPAHAPSTQPIVHTETVLVRPNPSEEADAAQDGDGPDSLASVMTRLEQVNDQIDAASTPQQIQSARYSHARATAAIDALTNSSPLLHQFLLELAMPESINGTNSPAYRVDDWERQAKLLFVVEPTMRTRIARRPDCPAEHRREYGRSNLKSLSPLSLKLLAALKAKGWLWHPLTRDTASANEHALYAAHVVKRAKEVFVDRTSHQLTDKWSTPANHKDVDRLPGGFFIRVDGVDELGLFAAVPEYDKLLVAGPSIFGGRGNKGRTSSKSTATDGVVDLKAELEPVPAVPPREEQATSLGNTAAPPPPDLSALLASDLFNTDADKPQDAPENAKKPTQPACYSSDKAQLITTIRDRLLNAVLIGDIAPIQELGSMTTYAVRLDDARELMGVDIDEVTVVLDGDLLTQPIALKRHGEENYLLVNAMPSS